jgi:hypothetical protein
LPASAAQTAALVPLFAILKFAILPPITVEENPLSCPQNDYTL